MISRLCCTLILVSAAQIGACAGEPAPDLRTPGEEISALQLTSTAFEDSASIPVVYTCDGDDHSPPLAWSGAPPRTASFTLICDDPDAPMGTWVHWVLFNIPADRASLPEGLPATERVDSGMVQGLTDFGRPGYGGPCPPAGKPHRYFFRLYALDAVLALEPGVKKADVEAACEGHILARAELVGTYSR